MRKHTSTLSTLLFSAAVALMMAWQTWAVLTGENPLEMLGVETPLGRTGVGFGLLTILTWPLIAIRIRNQNANNTRSL